MALNYAFVKNGKTHIIYGVDNDPVFDIPAGATNITPIADPANDLPTDREWRASWRIGEPHGGNRVGIDMVKAREQHINRIEQTATDKNKEDLPALIEAVADSNQGEINRLKAKRNKLKGLKQALAAQANAAANPNALKQVWDTDLD